MEANNSEPTSKRLIGLLVPRLEDKKWVMKISAVFLFIIFLHIAITNGWADLNNYYKNASEVLQGLIPYSQTRFEYPPLALVFMAIPYALSWNKESFFVFYSILACLFFFISVQYLYKIADRYYAEKWRAGALTLSLIFFGTYFLITRNDIFPATVVVIGLWLYLNKKYTPAFVLIAVAAMIKLYPGIFLLAMILPLVVNREWKICIRSIFSVAAVCLLVELPFLITDPSTAFAYLSYHSERGIQIESVVGSVFLVYQIIVSSDISVIFAYGCHALSGVGPDAVAPWMNPLLFTALFAFIVVMFIRCFRFKTSVDNLLYLSTLMMLALLLLFIMFSKVYSAQYVIWIALMVPFTQLSCFDKKQKASILRAYVMLGVFSFLSYITYTSLGLIDLNTVPVLLTVLKNVFFVVFLCIILRYCWLCTGPDQNAS